MDNLIQPILVKVRAIPARWVVTYDLEGLDDGQAKALAQKLTQADTAQSATYKFRGHAPRSLTLEVHKH